MIHRLRVGITAAVMLVVFASWPSAGSGAAGVAAARPSLTDLRGLDELKVQFNRDAGKVRMVLLLSPTCPVCVAGTRWVQSHILEHYPKANLRVYAVWFNMFPGDARAKWPATLLTDPRVTHRWDEAKIVGTWYGRHKDVMRSRLTEDSNGTGGDVLWDSYLLYDATARWDDMPTGLNHWGRTIVAGRETLRADADRLFAK